MQFKFEKKAIVKFELESSSKENAAEIFERVFKDALKKIKKHGIEIEISNFNPEE